MNKITITTKLLLPCQYKMKLNKGTLSAGAKVTYRSLRMGSTFIQ